MRISYKEKLEAKFDSSTFSNLTKDTGHNDDITVVCKIHGECSVKANSIMRKHVTVACLNCRNESSTRGKKTNIWFLAKAKEIHGDKYDYSDTRYISTDKKVKIIFEGKTHLQTPHMHLQGYEPEKNTSENGDVRDTVSCIRALREINGDKYDYSKVEYVTCKTPVTVICPVHGDFSATPNQLISRRSNCPSCAHVVSRGEQEIYEFCSELTPNIIRNNRTVLGGLELDLYFPHKRFAIEFNGDYWHSEAHKPKNYHMDKYQQALDKGVTLFQVWEWQWCDPLKREIIKSMIKHRLGCSHRLGARKTKLVQVSGKMVTEFYKDNHLQGHVRLPAGSITQSLQYKGVIVGMVSAYDNKIERLCFARDLAVLGGVQKLLASLPAGLYSSYINKDYGGSPDLYPNRVNVKHTEPSYRWARANMTLSRYQTMKHTISRQFDNYNGEPVDKFMRDQHWYKIFNAGNINVTFIVTREKTTLQKI